MTRRAIHRVLSKSIVRAVAGLGLGLGCVSVSHAATITWDGGGGNLNWLTPANWSGDALPGPGDDVVIDATGSVTVSLAGSASINSLSCADALTVSGGGTLTVASTANVGGVLSLTNGKLSGGTWTLPGGLVPTDASANTLTGVTLNGNASIGTNVRLFLSSGLTLNGTLTMSGSNPRLIANNTQTIGGNATIQLDSTNANSSRIHVEGTSVVTFAPTVLIESAFGEIGTHLSTAGVSSVINQGTIRSDTPGASLNLVGEGWINQGTMESAAGALTMSASQGWANDGLIRSVGGSVVLAGVVSPADLGDVRNVSGNVFLQASLDLAGGTLALDAVTGVWTLDGTTISNGTLGIASGATPVFTGSNTVFNDIEVNGNLALGSNQRLVIKNGLVLNGTMTLNGSNPRLIVDGTQTISGTATLQLDSANANASRIHIEGTSVLTFAPSVLVEGGFAEIGAHLGVGGVSGLINQGTIRCDTPGATFEIVGEQFSNEGTIEVTAGLLRIAAGNWTNTSTMTSLGGTLRLEGATTLASLDGVTNGGGAVQYATALNLTGQTFTLSAADGIVTFDGTTLTNGTLVVEPGAIPVFTGSNTTFDGMTVNGDLAIGTNQRLVIKNGLTLNGTLTMNGSNPRLIVNGTQTLAGNATLQLDSPNVNASRVHVEGTSVFTIAASVLIETAFADIGTHVSTAGVSAIINHGTIRGNTPGATLTIAGEQFTNTNLVEATAGAVAIAPSQSWTNSGLMRSAGGTLRLVGPTTFSALGDVRNVSGTVNVENSIDLGGAALNLNATTGLWTFDGATVSNGTVNVAAGATPLVTSNATTFDGVTVNGNLLIDSNDQLWLKSGLTLNGTLTMTGSNPRLVANGILTIGGSATILMDSPNVNASRLHVEGTSVLTLAPSVLIEGGFAEIGAHVSTAGVSSVVNQGTIRCDTSGAGFSIVGEQFTNTNLVEVTAGSLAIAPTQNWTNSGLMRAAGGTLRLVGPTTLASMGDVRNVSGVVEVENSLTLGGSTLNLNATTGVWTFDGATLTNGTLAVASGATPLFTNAATTFDAMTVNGSLLIGANHQLWIKNGLTLNGTLTMNGSNPRLVVNGTQTLGGNATVQLDSPNVNASRVHVEGTSILTIAPSVLIEGGWADIGTHLSTSGMSGVVNQGTIRADTSGATFTISTSNGDTFTNGGSVEATNGNLLIVESATNLSGAGTLTGGTWKANNATLRFGTLAAGTPIKTLAAECVLTGRNGKILDLAKLETITTSGVLRLNDGATLTAVPATGTLVDNGFLFLNGTSKLNVTGGFTHTSTAILTVATGAANQVFVDASAALNLDGFLQVSNGPGYTPIAGDQIVITDGSSRIGEFDTLTTCELADLFYTPTQAIYVYGEDTGVFADLNGDGFVGAADLALLLGSWGPCSDLCCNADLDLSGDVGAPDIALLLGSWG